LIKFNLEVLSDEISPKMQLRLGDRYRDKPFNDRAKAKHGYEETNENEKAQQRLRDLNVRISLTGASLFFLPKPNVRPKASPSTLRFFINLEKSVAT